MRLYLDDDSAAPLLFRLLTQAGHDVLLPAGAALSFDGKGSHVVLPALRQHLIRKSHSLTIAGSVRTDDTAGVKLIFDVGVFAERSISLYFEEKRFGWALPRAERLHRLAVPYDPMGSAWHHVAVVWNGKSMQTYVDGNSRGVMRTPTFVLSENNVADLAALIGGQAKSWPHKEQRYFRGQIDEFVIFDRALSMDEIQALTRRGELGVPLVP